MYMCVLYVLYWFYIGCFTCVIGLYRLCIGIYTFFMFLLGFKEGIVKGMYTVFMAY